VTSALQPFPWQQDTLSSWLPDRPRWPHAWLLHGPAGYGKRNLALCLARILLCESPGIAGACGRCPGCHWFEQGQHPDFRLVEPEVDEDETEKAPATVVKVQQIRALSEFLQLTTHRQGAKVVLFHPAEAMNSEAANALLKTLEEPPPQTYLLLVSHQPRRLYATLRSRCRAVPAPRPGPAQAQEWLAAQGSSDPALHLAQAGGAPLQALACADADWQEGRRELYAALSRPRTLSPVALGARIDAVPKARRRERLRQWCEWICAWMHDLAALAGGGEARFNPDYREPLARLAAGVAPIEVQRYYRELLRQRALLAHPLSPRLVAESLLLQYQLAVCGDASL
jgi:DNA polymerase-3 subunit delta'